MAIEPDRPFARTMRSLILEIPPVWEQPSIKPDERPSDKELEDAAQAEAKLYLKREKETYIERYIERFGEMEIGE